jgi:asparagine synthase (glutamine-hydrolysing)
LHLRSDVPVGSCLSGGVDSSSIVGVVAREHGVKMHTFSSCSTDVRFDEQTYIDAVNEHCDTRPLKIFPEPAECIRDLDDLVYHQDEPFTTLSVYAQYRVMQAARKAKVPVLLDGQGGDEALCGYRKFALLHLKQMLGRGQVLPASRHVLNLLREGDGGLLNLRAGQRFLPRWMRSRKASAVDLLQGEWRTAARHVWSERMRNIRTLHEVQLADLRQWSLPALLRYEDRNSMAHGIEARVPFVEHRFLEHCLTLPEPHYFRRGRTKRVLVEAIADNLPRQVSERRTKMGFVTPQEVWMRGPVGEALRQRVAQSEGLRSIVDVDRVSRAFQDFAAGKPTLSDGLLFRTASVAMWLNRFNVAA